MVQTVNNTNKSKHQLKGQKQVQVKFSRWLNYTKIQTKRLDILTLAHNEKNN